MEEKFNHATPQRPSGTRALDGQMVLVDLPKFIKEIKEEAAYHENGKNAITVFKSERVTTTLVALKKGEKVQSLVEEGHLLMSIYMIAGRIGLLINGNEAYLSEGQLVNYHYDCPFQAMAHTECVCLFTIAK